MRACSTEARRVSGTAPECSRVVYTCSAVDSGAYRPTIGLLGECAVKTVDRLAGDRMKSIIVPGTRAQRRGVRMMFIMITKTDRTLPDPPFRPDPMDLDWGANRRQSQLEGQLGRTGLCGPKRGLFRAY